MNFNIEVFYEKKKHQKVLITSSVQNQKSKEKIQNRRRTNMDLYKNYIYVLFVLKFLVS